MVINNNGNAKQMISMIAALKQKMITTIALANDCHDCQPHSPGLLRPYNKALFCGPATKQFSAVAPVPCDNE